MASSGAIALYHLVGVTPEAATEDEAFHGAPPEREFVVRLADLRAARDDLHTAVGGKLDLVVLGSPHFSLDEFRRLGQLVRGLQRDPGVRFLVTCGRGVRQIAEATGLLEPIIEFGGQITVDTCVLTTPMLGPEFSTLMTNSAKYAYYTPGLLEMTVAFGSLEDCVRSAVAGSILREDGPWAT
jgi:predicted aconitase